MKNWCSWRHEVQDRPESADLLTAAGHSEKLLAGHTGDAMTIYQQSLGGASDERIVDVCKDDDLILITSDLDSNLKPLAV